MEMFGTWEKRQDPAILYGTADDALIEHLREHFKYREICSDERMLDYFSRDMNEYLPHYYAMERLQRGNATMQPHINRYGEYLRITRGSESKEGTVTGETLKKGTSSGSKQSTDKWTRSGTITDASTKSGTASAQSGETGGDNRVISKSGTSHNSRVTGPHTETEVIDVTKAVDYDGETEAVTYDGRSREKKISGSFEKHTEGDGALNYTRDGDGSKVIEAHKVQTTDTTRQLGSKIIEEDLQEASKGKEASKAAPMQAIGIERVEDLRTGAFNAVRNGSITGLDFEFASGYGETAGETGRTGRRTERYEGDEGVISTAGHEKDNTDTTTYQREQQTGTDMTETTRYDQYSERETDTGAEIRTKNGGHTEKETGERKRNYSGDTCTEDGRTSSSDTDTLSINRRKTTSLTDTETGHNERKENGSETGTGSENTQATDRVEGESLQRSQGVAQDQRQTTNRFTGREGLTPHEALRGALEYLRTNPPCIQWLISMLEHNFIRVYEI